MPSSFPLPYDVDATGYLHSVETAGMVDGPGIRYVVFFSGCNLRCLYCHNPDTWELGSGYSTTVGEVIRDIKKYRSYLNFSGGGVTITGGEPFVQPVFLLELLKACKYEGFHTALDTSGFASSNAAEAILSHTDLLLFDLKEIEPAAYLELTGVPLEPSLRTLEHAREKNIPLWLRFVLVPGVTDKEEHLKKMAAYLKDFPNIERVEVLPFHKLGEYKWQALGLDYKLAHVPAATKEQVQWAKAFFA